MSPSRAAPAAMLVAACIHFGAYEFLRASSTVLFTAPEAWGPERMVHALALVPLFALAAVRVYAAVLHWAGPRNTLVLSTLACTAVLAAPLLFIASYGDPPLADTSPGADVRVVMAAAAYRAAVFALYLSREVYIAFLGSQYFSFINACFAHESLKLAIGPIYGVTSLASTLAAWGVAAAAGAGLSEVAVGLVGCAVLLASVPFVLLAHWLQGVWERAEAARECDEVTAPSGVHAGSAAGSGVGALCAPHVPVLVVSLPGTAAAAAPGTRKPARSLLGRFVRTSTGSSSSSSATTMGGASSTLSGVSGTGSSPSLCIDYEGDNSDSGVVEATTMVSDCDEPNAAHPLLRVNSSAERNPPSPLTTAVPLQVSTSLSYPASTHPRQRLHHSLLRTPASLSAPSSSSTSSSSFASPSLSATPLADFRSPKLHAPPRFHANMACLNLSPPLWPLFACTLAMQVLATFLGLAYQSLLQAEYPLSHDRTAVTGQYYAAINLAAGAVQFVGLPLFAKRLPMRLLVLAPVTASSACVAWLCAAPALPAASAALFVFKTCEYSMFSATKDIVFSPMSFEARHVAREFVDVFAYRLGKGATCAVMSLLMLVAVSTIPVGAQVVCAALSGVVWVGTSVWLANTLALVHPTSQPPPPHIPSTS